MTAGIVRIVRKLASYPNTSGPDIVTKKARAAGVKLITLNERRWNFQSDIRTFRTAIVFCLKGRMGRSRIDRVNVNIPEARGDNRSKRTSHGANSFNPCQAIVENNFPVNQVMKYKVSKTFENAIKIKCPRKNQPV
ncbi:hypothetical protein AVEN_130489-1 [Araneus ventricosus]|uniref:Uncharacterized protein n=1 Tax=Araneus ventricosus TaxID=182803 RepID=A0A4Y2N3P7_ARAVE|nr:hypothetical protein AVEN_130489-1 [Araneus ventricosus]